MMFSFAYLATLDILKMKRKRVTSITGITKLTKLTMLQCGVKARAGVKKYVVYNYAIKGERLKSSWLHH